MQPSNLVLYPWLNETWQQLQRYVTLNRIPSGLMFVADKGYGVSQLVRLFAQSTFCEQSQTNGMPCEHCSHCVLFKAGTYPDFHVVEPEEDKTSISIDSIRTLIETLTLSNQYLQQRIAVIDPADKISISGSNSLLKTLEEPQDNTSIVLIAEDEQRVPATIKSRCQIIKVNKADTSDMLGWLESNGCTEPELFLNLAHHSPLTALELSTTDVKQKRAQLIDDFLKLIKKEKDPIEFAASTFEKQNRQNIRWLLSLCADLSRLHTRCHMEQLENPDLFQQLQDIHQRLNLKLLRVLNERLQRMLELKGSQINGQLLLEDFAITCLVGLKK